MRIIPGNRYKKAFDVSLGVLKENRLFLSCAANYTNLSEIEEAFCSLFRILSYTIKT